MIHIPDKPSFSPAEVATLLQVKRQTVYNWMKKGIIDFVRLGSGTKRIPREAVIEFQEERKR